MDNIVNTPSFGRLKPYDCSIPQGGILPLMTSIFFFTFILITF